jgi:integrase
MIGGVKPVATLYAKKRSPFVWIGYSLDGVRMNRSTGIPWIKKRDGSISLPPEAAEMSKQIEARIKIGSFDIVPQAQKNRYRISDLRDYFLEAKAVRLAPNSKRLYRLAVQKAIKVLGDVYADYLSEAKMFSLRTELIELDGEVNASAWIRHLAAVFSFAARKKLIRENPITADVKFKPPDQPVRCYTEHQLSNLLLTADAEGCEGLSDQLLFLKFSGFRSEESCTVKWSQVDPRRRIIRYWNQKGKRWTDQPMDREFLEFISGLTHKYEPYLFHYRSSSGLNHAARRINELLGHSASLNVHTLKTCAVGRWKAMGLDMLTISALAHHRDIDTTRRHYDYFDTDRILTAMDGALSPITADTARVNGKVATLPLHSTSELPSEAPSKKEIPESVPNSGNFGAGGRI